MLNMQEFGNRVQLIREDVLLMTQAQLAEKLGITQVLLSRLERGIGGNINTVFDIVNYLYSQDIAGMYIFSDHFSIDMVSEKSNNPVAVGSQIEELIKEMQKTINNDMDKLLMKLSLQNPKNS